MTQNVTLDGVTDLGIPYTYQNKHGTYYFRLVLTDVSSKRRTAIRFSLGTRNPAEARVRSYRGWLYTQSHGAIKTKAAIKKYVMTDELRKSVDVIAGETEQQEIEQISFGPPLVKLTDVLDSWDSQKLQLAIRLIADDGGEIFAPFGAADNCSFFPIREVGRPEDPAYEEFLSYPLEVDYFVSAEVVLTDKSIQSACHSVNGNFEVDEFYSYYPGGWSRRTGFSAIINPPSPILLMVSQLMISLESAKNLKSPTALSVDAPIDELPNEQMLLSEGFRAYADECHSGDHWTDRTRADNESVFDAFIEIIGDKPIKQLTDADVKKYVVKINNLPPNRKKDPTFSGLDALQAIDKNIEIKGKTISTRSKQKYIQRLKARWNVLLSAEPSPTTTSPSPKVINEKRQRNFRTVFHLI